MAIISFLERILYAKDKDFFCDELLTLKDQDLGTISIVGLEKCSHHSLMKNQAFSLSHMSLCQKINLSMYAPHSKESHILSCEQYDQKGKEI